MHWVKKQRVYIYILRVCVGTIAAGMENEGIAKVGGGNSHKCSELDRCVCKRGKRGPNVHCVAIVSSGNSVRRRPIPKIHLR